MENTTNDHIENILAIKLRALRGDEFSLPLEINYVKQKLTGLENKLALVNSSIAAILEKYPNIHDPIKPE